MVTIIYTCQYCCKTITEIVESNIIHQCISGMKWGWHEVGVINSSNSRKEVIRRGTLTSLSLALIGVIMEGQVQSLKLAGK